MLIPKASHLVERVAERLLRSGALGESAAQLLRPSGAETVADSMAGDGSQAAPNGVDAHRAQPSQRSSLFALPPGEATPKQQPPTQTASAVPGVPVNEAGPAAADADFHSPSANAEVDPPASPAPVAQGPPLPSPAILGQARLPASDRAADFASPDAGRALR